ncbi:MAG: histidine phosphatase family protein [Pyrinomonadaceae bacterium]
MRHAKSSWDDPSLRDFDRPLNNRGLKSASLIGRFMLKRKIRPGLVISSPAKRARKTAALVIKSAQLESKPRLDERIYEASAIQLLEVISQIETSAEEVLLVGHNPGMEDLLLTLTGEVRRMPTAALARVALDIERWSDARETGGQLEWLVKPKELTDD